MMKKVRSAPVKLFVSLASVSTMVAGIYGMNFENMPELQSRFGYPVVLISLLLVTTLLYRKFKKANWL